MDRRWLLVMTFLVALPTRPHAQEEVIDREFELKAAYLYNFGRYVEWPKNAAADVPFVIGILGKDPFGHQLDRIAAQKTILGRKISILRFNSPKEVKPCQILFVASRPAQASDKETPAERLRAALDMLKDQPVLVVTDSSGLASKGAAITFVVDLDENRIKLEINPDAVKRQGLKVSSRLLALKETGVVKIVQDEKRPD
jgi:hypothetical protein